MSSDVDRSMDLTKILMNSDFYSYLTSFRIVIGGSAQHSEGEDCSGQRFL